MRPGDHAHSGGDDDETPPVRGRVREVRRYASAGHNVTEQVFVTWHVRADPTTAQTRRADPPRTLG